MKSGKLIRVVLILVVAVGVATAVAQALLFNTTTVVVATVDIPVGVPIETSMIKLKTINQDGKEPDSFSDLKELEGAYSTGLIKANAQMTLSNSASAKNPHNLSALIPEGKIGILLPVNKINGFSRNLAAGDKISLLATVSTTKGSVTGNSVKDAIVLAEQVPILSVEKTSDGSDIVGYQVALDPQVAKDTDHILSTQDHDNQATIRVVLPGYNNKDVIIPRGPIGDISSRYIQADK